MENLFVANADTDMHGAQKENIFIALDRNGAVHGLLFIYPYFDYDIEPEHPHNLYLHLHIEQGKELSEADKDVLLDKAIQRAAEIKREAEQSKTRVYACFLKHQQAEITYFLKRGFMHDESMHILEKPRTSGLDKVGMPAGVAVQSWKLNTDDEQDRFIEIHREIFPRHPYSLESLRELKSLPGWNNFTAFSGDEIAGNIMVFIDPDNNSFGIIEDLFVLSRWRRRGVGRYLLYTALVYLESRDIDHVRLELWSANKNAFQLYREFGFTSIDETEIAVGRYV